ncbi:MAG: beta-lactamase hydrolase domain-containing protein [Panacagrimonas sp.]
MTRLTDVQFPFAGSPAPDLITGGQPTAEDFKTMAAAGLKHVINLRPTAEDAGFDEAALAAKLGLRYTLIPIAGAGDLTEENAKKLDAAMASAPGQPTLIHCASSNRVGGLLAVRAARVQGTSNDDALAFGRAAGLTKMEPQVAQILSDLG